MNLELQSATEFRPLKAVKHMPSLICAVKHQQHVFKPFVFEQVATGVPTYLSFHHDNTYSTRCTMNQVNLTPPPLAFKNTQPYTMFSNIIATVILTQTAQSHCQSLCQHNLQDTGLKHGTSKLSYHAYLFLFVTQLEVWQKTPVFS